MIAELVAPSDWQCTATGVTQRGHGLLRKVEHRLHEMQVCWYSVIGDGCKSKFEGLHEWEAQDTAL